MRRRFCLAWGWSACWGVCNGCEWGGSQSDCEPEVSEPMALPGIKGTPESCTSNASCASSRRPPSRGKQWASTTYINLSCMSKRNTQRMPSNLSRRSRLALPMGNTGNHLVAVPVASHHIYVQRKHASSTLERCLPKLLVLASISLG